MRSKGGPNCEPAAAQGRPDDAFAGMTRCFRNTAVLFADIVGFTRMVEGQPPETTIDILRRYYSRMSATVGLHQGRIAQFTGDTVMAIFGAGCLGCADATNALACAYGMLGAMAQWNARRQSRGRFPIHIGVGVHVGDVAVGDIMIGQHREQTIAGDTVNVARKLETLTRKLASPLVVSCNLVDAVKREAANTSILTPLRKYGNYQIPSRASPLAIWVL
jgi:class 3 adenylate cyclase